MTTLNAQSASNPVAGSYSQPAPGVTLAGVTPYRDTNVSFQSATTAAAPAAAANVATVTPTVAGLYEVRGTVAVAGTTVAAADSNNMNLKAGTTSLLAAIPCGVTGTTGMAGSVPFGPVIVKLDGSTAVTVNAVANATASSSYAAQIIATLIG